MSESEVQLLWRGLNDLRSSVSALTATITAQQSLIAEMRQDVKHMATNGCVKASQHADHETRLRDVEKSRNMLAGMASLAGAFLGVVGSWLMKKIGG